MSRIEGTPNQVATRLHQHYELPFVGDGVTAEFFLTKTVSRLADLVVSVNGVRQRVSDRGTAHDYSVRGLTPGYPGDRNAIKFTVVPIAGVDILINLVST